MLKISLHGVRGSRPRHRKEAFVYGGNSTCLEFHTDPDFFIFVDGGSGLIKRGQDISSQPNAAREFHFLMTHTHWDHIIGLPYFAPLFESKNHITYYAADTHLAKFRDLFARLLHSTSLGYDPKNIRAKIDFVSVAPDSQFTIGEDVRIETFQLNHQGMTLAFRVHYKGHSGTIVTDHAPVTPENIMGQGMKEAAAGVEHYEAIYKERFTKFLSHCDLVVYDTHFTEANLKLDWGHSTPDRALQICADARVGTLALFHHAPEDTDAEVEAKVASISKKAALAGVRVIASKEGYRWSPV